MTRLALVAVLLCLLAPPALAQDANYYNADKTRPPHGVTQAPTPAPAAAPAPTTPADITDSNGGGDDAAAADSQGDDGDGDTTAAEPEVEIMPAHSAVVTSIDTCLNQLDAEDQAAVRSNFTNPYQDCQQRLAGKTAAKKTVKAGKRKNGPEAENARNFVRVKPPKADDDAAATAPAGDDSAGSEKIQTGNWSSSVKPDKSKAKLNP